MILYLLGIVCAISIVLCWIKKHIHNAWQINLLWDWRFNISQGRLGEHKSVWERNVVGGTVYEGNYMVSY